MACRPSSDPKVYPITLSLDPSPLLRCGDFPMESIFGSNIEVEDVTWMNVPNSGEQLLISQRRGPIHQLSVQPDNDLAHWGLIGVPPEILNTFQSNNCVETMEFCYVSSTAGTTKGFAVVDQHRVQEYGYSFQAGSVASKIASLGLMDSGSTLDPSVFTFNFPSFVAQYSPYSATQMTEQFPVTTRIPDAGSRFFFVSDTGRKQIVMLNTTTPGQMQFVAAFAMQGEPADVAVFMPSWEYPQQPIFANVFVVDRTRNALVKLNVGYASLSNAQSDQLGPEMMAEIGNYDFSQVGMAFSTEYREDPGGVNFLHALTDPVGVSIFRHYVFVAEASGSTIVCLAVDANNTDNIMFVTRFTVARNIRLLGRISVTPLGYVWYNYVNLLFQNCVGSAYLPQSLITSPAPSMLSVLRNTCINQTYYYWDLLRNEQLCYQVIGNQLDLAGVNWRYPQMPDWLNISSFIKYPYFDLNLLNSTVYDGELKICAGPAPATTPAMLSGNANGWNVHGSSNTVIASSSSSSRREALVATSALFACLFS